MNVSDNYVLRDERFPELHELLDSYASTGWTFTDTPEKAGPALQAYVRQAVRAPGLLDSVVDEIDDLLTVGLFNEAIADDVDILPHIEPPAGRSLEQCFALIRDHLERIRNGGTYDHSDLPQTDWEWWKQFPGLRHLLAGYFHQEFSRFYTSHAEALDDYFTGNPTDMFAEAAREIGSLLSLVTSDSELDRATEVLGLMVYPPEGVSLRQWLTDIQGIITHHVHSTTS